MASMALSSLTDLSAYDSEYGYFAMHFVIIATRNILVIEHYSLLIKLHFTESDINISGVWSLTSVNNKFSVMVGKIN